MGSFKNYKGMVVMNVVEGQNAAGETVRVERVERPQASTLGYVWVRVFVNGVGVSAEQFSRTRVHLADTAFRLAAKQIGGKPVAPKPAKAAGGAPARAAKPAPESLVFDEAGIQVVMITGKSPRFEIRRSGIEAETIPATRAWRAEQQQAIARAQALIAA